jgi:hypothetical protein
MYPNGGSTAQQVLRCIGMRVWGDHVSTKDGTCEQKTDGGKDHETHEKTRIGKRGKRKKKQKAGKRKDNHRANPARQKQNAESV